MIARIKLWGKIIFVLLERRVPLLIVGITLGVSLPLFWRNWWRKLTAFWPQKRYIGVVGRWTPQTLPLEITQYASTGLLTLLPNGKATASAILARWEVEQEGRVYRFELKKNVFWQDKTQLLAKDIQYPIQGGRLKAIGATTLEIHLEKPFAPLPILLTKPLFKPNFVGLGDYRIIKIDNAGGFLKTLVLKRDKKPKRQLIFRFYPNQDALLAAFKLGEINEAWGVQHPKELVNWPNIKIIPRKRSFTRYTAVFFNTRHPKLNNKRVRQALAYATPKPNLKNRALSPFSPLNWAYTNKVKHYSFDPSHAQVLWQKVEERPTQLTLFVFPELLKWGEEIETNWEKILGIEVNLRVISFVPTEFEAFLGYGEIPPDPDQYQYWHSDQPQNITRLSHPRIDYLLEKGRTTIDYQQRKEIYQKLQRALVEECPAVFLFYPKNYNLVRQSGLFGRSAVQIEKGD